MNLHSDAPRGRRATTAGVAVFLLAVLGLIWGLAVPPTGPGGQAVAVYAACGLVSVMLVIGAWLFLRAMHQTHRSAAVHTKDQADGRRESVRERLFDQLLAGTNEGYWLIDNAARTLDLNEAMCRLLGRSREEVLGRSIYDFVDETNAAVFDREMAERASGRSGVYEVELTRKDGSKAVCLNNASVLRDETGAKVGAFGLFTDIGRLKAVQDELESARAAAEAASRAKSQFLANMSHEIRTPMNGVVGMAELLLREPLEKRAQNHAATIRRSARLLLRVLDDILDLSRIEAGILKIEAVTFSLAHAVGEMEQLFGEPARAKGVRLQVSLEPGLPAFVNGDPVRLRQILLNLVANAVKFTARGQIDISACRAQGGRFRFAVRDSGIGIPLARQAGIFEAFAQNDESNARRFGGTGLGLAICRELVRRMGGEVGVQSEPESGSVFWVELPLAEVSTPAPQVPTRRVRRRFDGSTVLLVEDDPVNTEVARIMLEQCGIAVVCAGTGLEALAALPLQPIDLVLMDCQMPVMDGLEATRRIRDREAARGAARMPIVAVTAHAIAGYRQQCIDAGMDDYLAKPFEGAALEDLLLRWLAGSPSGGGGLAPDGSRAGAAALDGAPIEVLRSLDPRGSDGLVARVVGLFLETAPQSIELLRVQAGADRIAAQRAAHSLKSSAAQVGAMRLSALAAQAEARLREGDAEGIEALADGLQAAMHEAAPELQALMRQMEPTPHA